MPLRRVITGTGLFRCHRSPLKGGVSMGSVDSLRAYYTARYGPITHFGASPVDPQSGLAATHTVYHSDGNLPVSATLSSAYLAVEDLDNDKTDNTFYVLQVLVANDSSSDTPFVVLRRRGYLCDIGGEVATEKFANLQTAINRFAKHFLDLTGNSWLPYTLEHVHKFENKKRGKYDWVDRPLGWGEVMPPLAHAEELKATKINEIVLSAAPSHSPAIVLPQETRDLMALLFNKSFTCTKHTAKHVEDMNSLISLHCLSDCALTKGRAILQELLPILASAKKASRREKAATKRAQCKPKKSSTVQADASAEVKVSQEHYQRQIQSLSNQFHSHIPRRRGASLLNSPESIASMLLFLDNVEFALLTMRLMEEPCGTHDPRLGQYKQLGVDLVPMARQSCDEAKLIEQYFENTSQGRLVLKQMWKLSRDGEEQRFDPWKAFPNRKLLWHGSPTRNWVRILSQGLKSRHALHVDLSWYGYPRQKAMFDRGIHFTDMARGCAFKSYCLQRSGSEGGLLALCEVALGTPCRRYPRDSIYGFVTKLPRKVRSAYTLGGQMPNPIGDVALPGGLVVPAGRPIGRGLYRSEYGMLRVPREYNDFVVYDASQIRLKYLLHVEFVCNENND